MIICYSMVVDDDVIDIDTYDDGDSQTLRDTLHWEAASNPSPDSTSTTNSMVKSIHLNNTSFDHVNTITTIFNNISLVLM